MTILCEKCNGKKYLYSETIKMTCYVCKGVGRRKLVNLDLISSHPRSR